MNGAWIALGWLPGAGLLSEFRRRGPRVFDPEMSIIEECSLDEETWDAVTDDASKQSSVYTGYG